MPFKVVLKYYEYVVYGESFIKSVKVKYGVQDSIITIKVSKIIKDISDDIEINKPLDAEFNYDIEQHCQWYPEVGIPMIYVLSKHDGAYLVAATFSKLELENES